MKVYLIVDVYRVNGCRVEYLTNKCFANKDKAINYCHVNNKHTYDYLQSCTDNYELLEIREIEVEE